MTTFLIDGARTWRGGRDAEGHREYEVKLLVGTNDPRDGPARVLQTPGLPVPGTQWIIDNDIDIWAWCRWDCTVEPLVENEPNLYWECSFKFGTRPPATGAGSGRGSASPGRGGGGGGGDNSRAGCRDFQVEDPVLEPQKVSFSLTHYTEEALEDRFGKKILNSAKEQQHGPNVEFDASRLQIHIEQNVFNLEFTLLEDYRDSVNDSALWGIPKRCIKLSDVSAERKFYGSCYRYYTRRFTFDVWTRKDRNGATVSAHDRELIDAGFHVLNGRWNKTTGNWELVNIGGAAPNPNNPAHYMDFIDRVGNTASTPYLLDGAGKPLNVALALDQSNLSTYVVQKYQERNFLALGIPLLF